MTSRSDLNTRIETGLRCFAERMSAMPSLEDAKLTARIVGEFSAGKTRLVRELLGGIVPDALAPVSSRDAQTRLPLEVTYGPVAQLAVVERANDLEQGRECDILDRFPTRQEVDALNYHASEHRLRLSLPLEQLALPDGDGYDDEHAPPSRMFLIDMPGWNSGDDAIAEEDARVVLHAEFSLALVYVTQAGRLDSATNRQRLADFLEALAEADFAHGPKLLMVLTHCDEEDAARLSKRARALVDDVWARVGSYAGTLALDILCAEFNEMPEAGRVAFRQRFWNCLLAPLQQPRSAGMAPVEHPWLARIRNWPAQYDIRPRLVQVHALLGILRRFAGRTCRNGEFLPGMHMQRLVILDDEEISAKLRSAWQRQAEPAALEEAEASLVALRLDPEHPLSDWWNDVWIDQARLLLLAARSFCTQAQAALNRVDRATPDIQLHLRRHLAKPHARMQAALTSSFASQVDATLGLAERPLANVVSTLLVLGAMQGHYERGYARQLQLLRRENERAP